jgi:hypothetical protein
MKIYSKCNLFSCAKVILLVRNKSTYTFPHSGIVCRGIHGTGRTLSRLFTSVLYVCTVQSGRVTEQRKTFIYLLLFFKKFLYTFCTSAAPQRPAHDTVLFHLAAYCKNWQKFPRATEGLDSNPNCATIEPPRLQSCFLYNFTLLQWTWLCLVYFYVVQADF